VDPSGEVVSELMRLTAGLRRIARRRVISELGVAPLPEAQRELLLTVEANPGIGVAGAAARLGMAGNSVSTLVNALVDACLLVRETDPNDRRAVRLSLTEAATRRLDAWRTARAALLGGALDKGGEEDRKAIEAALPALRRLLDELVADSAPQAPPDEPADSAPQASPEVEESP
jgi:DNA-binding MarR family transcriptional regulator